VWVGVRCATAVLDGAGVGSVYSVTKFQFFIACVSCCYGDGLGDLELEYPGEGALGMFGEMLGGVIEFGGVKIVVGGDDFEGGGVRKNIAVVVSCCYYIGTGCAGGDRL